MADNDVLVECQDTGEILSLVLTAMRNRCYEESQQNLLAVPLNDPDARLQYYSGLSLSSVHKLIQKPKVSKLDMQSRVLLLDTVKNMYALNKIQQCPVNVLNNEISKNGQLKTVEGKEVNGLHEVVDEMETLGFQWKKTVQNARVLMEIPMIRFERYMYLNMLKKYRNSQDQWQIVYVDERIINNALDFPKPWLKMENKQISTAPSECVFYHAVSKSGFITGMFSNQVSENDFRKWLTDILLMHLKSPTVIVMDNNPLHGSLENVCSVTSYHSKIDMIRWLMNNNIPCSISMSKPALFELIRKCNENQQEYKIDRIIRSQGHAVLRLPRHFYDLSMTTPLWDGIKRGELAPANSLVHVQNNLMNRINAIPLAQWAEYEQEIVKQVEEIFKIDMAMEKLCDKFDIKVAT